MVLKDWSLCLIIISLTANQRKVIPLKELLSGVYQRHHLLQERLHMLQVSTADGQIDEYQQQKELEEFIKEETERKPAIPSRKEGAE